MTLCWEGTSLASPKGQLRQPTGGFRDPFVRALPVAVFFLAGQPKSRCLDQNSHLSALNRCRPARLLRSSRRRATTSGSQAWSQGSSLFNLPKRQVIQEE